jgi:hypothetical protein
MSLPSGSPPRAKSIEAMTKAQFMADTRTQQAASRTTSGRIESG